MKIKNPVYSLFVFIVGLILIISPFFLSGSSSVALDEFPNATFSNLSIIVDVGEDGTMSFANSFDVTFNRSGLSEVTYALPYVGKRYIVDESGKVSTKGFVAKVTNAEVSKPSDQAGSEELYMATDEVAGFITLVIRNNDYFTYGETRHYTLTYDYQPFINNKTITDMVYVNLLGGGNVSDIENVSFEIHLPHAIDFSEYLPKVYCGEFGSDNEVSVTATGQTISGSVSVVKAGEYLTLLQTLPENYLTPMEYNWFTVWKIIAAALTGLAVILALIIKIRNHAKSEVVTPVEVVAFEGLTPELAELYAKKKITTKSFSALIIYFANAGCIKIVQENDENITLVKIKEFYDEKTPELNRFFKMIFAGAETNVTTNQTSDGTASVTAEVSKEESISIKELAENKDAMSGFDSLKTKRVGKVENKTYESKNAKQINTANFVLLVAIIFNTACAVIFDPCNFFGFTAMALGAKIATGLWFYLGLSAFAAAAILLYNKPPYQNEFAMMRGRVLGLKNYITMVEKSRLEVLVKDNPNFFFDVLPYAYVLDVSDVWINQFKTIEINQPNWVVIESGTLFDAVWFNYCFSRFHSTIVTSLNMRNISQSISVGHSSGGGFSGGGFSGGGFSGGGVGGGSFGAR